MGNLSGKIVEAFTKPRPKATGNIGPDLRKLRLLSGLTQKQVACRMNIQQAAISKIERGGEVYLSTVRRYVEALGASLHLDACFPADAPLSLRLREAFEPEHVDDNQLVLPHLGDEPFKPQRDVVLSIKPTYSNEILAGRKTVELRRRFPVSAPRGTLAYIYSTSPVKAMVGMASIREILRLPVEQIWSTFEDCASIERTNFDSYFDGLDHGFALVFEDVKEFSRPLSLDELRQRFNFQPPQSFLYAQHDLREALRNEPAIVSH